MHCRQPPPAPRHFLWSASSPLLHAPISPLFISQNNFLLPCFYIFIYRLTPFVLLFAFVFPRFLFLYIIPFLFLFFYIPILSSAPVLLIFHFLFPPPRLTLASLSSLSFSEFFLILPRFLFFHTVLAPPFQPPSSSSSFCYLHKNANMITSLPQQPIIRGLHHHLPSLTLQGPQPAASCVNSHHHHHHHRPAIHPSSIQIFLLTYLRDTPHNPIVYKAIYYPLYIASFSSIHTNREINGYIALEIVRNGCLLQTV